MDDDNDSDGWGRPRPKFSDLFHSMTPENSDDDDNREMNVMDEDDKVERTERVAPLIDYPLTGYVGAPLGELNQSYVNQGFTKGLKNCFTAWDNGMKTPHTRYTCVFTCPVSGEHFASGDWHNEKGVTVIDDVYWYVTKKYAMIAAAARTLDCLSLRRCHGTEKQPYQRCVDQPYLCSDDAPNLLCLPSDIELPKLSHQADSDAQSDAKAPPPPAKRALNEWYLSFSKKLKDIDLDIDRLTDKISPGNENYYAWSNQKNSPDTLFTAIYTCHLSGERFASGKLFGKEDKYKEDCWYFDGTNLIPGDMLEDGSDQLSVQKICFVWYKTKKDALIAAAGRAIDCLVHRDSLLCQKHPGTVSDRRYCMELPYTVEDIPEMWKQVSESVHTEGGGESASLLRGDFFTEQLGVADLHSFLEDEHDEENWRAKYKDRRRDDGNTH